MRPILPIAILLGFAVLAAPSTPAGGPPAAQATACAPAPLDFVCASVDGQALFPYCFENPQGGWNCGAGGFPLHGCSSDLEAYCTWEVGPPTGIAEDRFSFLFLSPPGHCHLRLLDLDESTCGGESEFNVFVIDITTQECLDLRIPVRTTVWPEPGPVLFEAQAVVELQPFTTCP